MTISTYELHHGLIFMAFKVENIVIGCFRYGIWPLNFKHLIGTGIQKSFANNTKLNITNIQDIGNQHYDAKFIYGLQEPIIKHGFVDTTHGIHLTRHDVIKLMADIQEDLLFACLERAQRTNVK